MAKKTAKAAKDKTAETKTKAKKTRDSDGKRGLNLSLGKKSGKKKGKGAAEDGTPKEYTTFDAIRFQKLKLRQQGDIKTFFTRAILMVVLLGGLFLFLFGMYAQRTEDMAPKISAGDLMLYYRLDHNFKTQDVVVFEKNGKTYSGRVVAKAGDTVDITDEGGLVVNGSQMIEAEIFYTTPKYEETVISYPLTLSVDQYFVLGDRREGAQDSRSFGPVNVREVKGKVITVFRRNNI